jgi:hypothetical protein
MSLLRVDPIDGWPITLGYQPVRFVRYLRTRARSHR